MGPTEHGGVEQLRILAVHGTVQAGGNNKEDGAARTVALEVVVGDDGQVWLPGEHSWCCGAGGYPGRGWEARYPRLTDAELGQLVQSYGVFAGSAVPESLYPYELDGLKPSGLELIRKAQGRAQPLMVDLALSNPKRGTATYREWQVRDAKRRNNAVVLKRIEGRPAEWELLRVTVVEIRASWESKCGKRYLGSGESVLYGMVFNTEDGLVLENPCGWLLADRKMSVVPDSVLAELSDADRTAVEGSKGSVGLTSLSVGSLRELSAEAVADLLSWARGVGCFRAIERPPLGGLFLWYAPKGVLQAGKGYYRGALPRVVEGVGVAFKESIEIKRERTR